MESIENAYSWSGHNEHISELLKCMFFQKYNTDVTLITEDNKIIEAHKPILSACSPLLRNILDTKASTIFLSEIKYAEFEKVLKFMYLGEVVVEKDELKDFLSLKSKLLMNDLTNNSTASDDQKQETPKSTKIQQLEANCQKQENSITNEIEQLKANYQIQENPTTTKIEQLKANSYKQSESVTSIAGDENVEFGEQFFCNHCDYFSENREDLESHELSVHSYLSKGNKREHKCLECGKVLSSKTKLQNHYEMHKRQNQKSSKFTCPTCNTGFTNEYNLKKHMKIHDIDQCHLCDKCDYRSPLLKNLTRHKMVVHDEDKFSCGYCDYKTVYELHLKRHTNFYHKEQMGA